MHFVCIVEYVLKYDPFDALFWSPEYEYSEFSMGDMLHDKDRLDEWLKTVPEGPGLES